MGPAKIVRMLATAVAVIAAFVTIPYAGLIMALLGLGIGYFVAADDRVRFLVTAIALTTAVASGLGDIPAVGEYITAIFGNVSTIINSGALVVIGTGIYEKVME
ncbi:MAG: hypothetical protein O6931_08315 [Gammaproteobacteria bacterium]|nr:hypothetical protein [Gammaproteobacteria bacterium]